MDIIQRTERQLGTVDMLLARKNGTIRACTLCNVWPLLATTWWASALES